MAKGDKYFLIDKNGYTVAKFELTGDYMTGDCYTCCSWELDKAPVDYHYFAGVYSKWDSCTHWYFRGEDFDQELNISGDSYYHICGSGCFLEHVRIMCFLWKVAAMYLKEEYEREGSKYTDPEREYFDNDEIKKLVEMMLEGCEIKKEKNHD